jgi:hypothetical protein
MKTETIIQKIRKCLSLSKSPNANEAAAAMAKAQQLMAEYQVTMADIALSEVKEHTEGIGQRVNPTTAMHHLAGTIAKVFSCEIYYTQIGWSKGGVVFVGVEPSAEIAGYAWDVLRRKMEQARKEFLGGVSKRFKRSNRIARADQYCIGWVVGVRRACEKLVPATELPAIIEQYLSAKRDLVEKEARPARKPNTNSAAAEWDANQGYQDGSQVDIQQGVKGGVGRTSFLN